MVLYFEPYADDESDKCYYTNFVTTNLPDRVPFNQRLGNWLLEQEQIQTDRLYWGGIPDEFVNPDPDHVSGIRQEHLPLHRQSVLRPNDIILYRERKLDAPIGRLSLTCRGCLADTMIASYGFIMTIALMAIPTCSVFRKPEIHNSLLAFFLVYNFYCFSCGYLLFLCWSVFGRLCTGIHELQSLLSPDRFDYCYRLLRSMDLFSVVVQCVFRYTPGGWVEALQMGRVVLRLEKQPDMFTSPWLQVLNNACLVWNDWQTWKAVDKAFYELEGSKEKRLAPLELSISELEKQRAGSKDECRYIVL
ncbi:hypothetical protein QBC44DRAFT_368145 [Cladorrhinum sp. PSN332]|nr:hypothetical protein QBC44DRAFT_368145 [Cladorrhinum sp. PSN332]